MTRTRRTLLVALAVSLATVGAGCGGGGAEDEVTVEAPLDLLSAIEDAGSARVSVRIDDDAPSDGLDDGFGTWRVRGEVQGVAAFDDVRSSFAGSIEVAVELPDGAVDEPPAPLAWDLELRAVGDESWTRESSSGEWGPWVQEMDHEEFEEVGEPIDDGDESGDAVDGEVEDGELDEDEEGDDPFALLDPASFDPAGFVEALRDAADGFTEVGPDDVRGDATTRYRVALDPSIGETGDWYGLDGQVEVWLDARERLRRVRGGAIEMELWDFGVPVDVEPPADAVDIDDSDAVGFGEAEVVGEWELQAEGTTGDHAWEVFSAPARHGDVDVTCRTLEIVGAEVIEEEWYGDEGPLFPQHEGVSAVCGPGVFFFGGGVADPALQVVGDQDFSSEPTGLVAFVVSERFRGGPVRVVLDGADPVELPLNGEGLVVWDASTTATVVAVELDGGAVRCPVSSPFGELEDGAEGEAEEDEYAPTAAEQLSGGTAPCVRA